MRDEDEEDKSSDIVTKALDQLEKEIEASGAPAKTTNINTDATEANASVEFEVVFSASANVKK